MREPPSPDSNPQQSPEPSVQQTNSGSMDGGQQAAIGNYNHINNKVNHINLLVQIETMIMPIAENDQTISDSLRNKLNNHFNQLRDEAENKEMSNRGSEALTKNVEYSVEEVFKVETIYAHYAITSYLKPIRVRCNLTLSTASATLEAIDITEFYDDEYLYAATKSFCDFLFICLDWLYESVKWFCALPIEDSLKENLEECPRQLFEHAFDIFKKKAEDWTEVDEVSTEVSVYLNLLLNQIYD